jgi:DNA-binding transcriptional ArsR family regulator
MEREDLYQSESELCRILTHPVRLRILDELREGEKAAGELCPGLDTTKANISAHLALLRKAGAVAVRRDGQRLYYSVSYPRIFEAFDIMRGVLLTILSEQGAKYEKLKKLDYGKGKSREKS